MAHSTIQTRRGIASLCIGVFLLASTGLTERKKSATHWVEADAFREMFPDVNLVPDKIITDEQGIYYKRRCLFLAQSRFCILLKICRT
jgi:transcriptional regulator GlxA family with amidase domain